MKLFIIVEENFPEWKVYEVWNGRLVLRTKNWAEIVAFFNGNIPEPEICFVH